MEIGATLGAEQSLRWEPRDKAPGTSRLLTNRADCSALNHAHAAQLPYRLQAFGRKGCSVCCIVAAAFRAPAVELPFKTRQLPRTSVCRALRIGCAARSLSSSSAHLVSGPEIAFAGGDAAARLPSEPECSDAPDRKQPDLSGCGAGYPRTMRPLPAGVTSV